ncbi:hypothetical protein Bhyg_07879 [Pseudolycoriella hygida]|uniref:Uncharacterized protein n=1 Tax=Pseudolycoriella hygida TaxID=35572 RepID=A0A9Q0N3I4_9DIPT|nr:hypothetical protein Bhyg_07879 [Pseudolycoriella hygida]
MDDPPAANLTATTKTTDPPAANSQTQQIESEICSEEMEFRALSNSFKQLQDITLAPIATSSHTKSAVEETGNLRMQQPQAIGSAGLLPSANVESLCTEKQSTRLRLLAEEMENVRAESLRNEQMKHEMSGTIDRLRVELNDSVAQNDALTSKGYSIIFTAAQREIIGVAARLSEDLPRDLDLDLFDGPVRWSEFRWFNLSTAFMPTDARNVMYLNGNSSIQE